MKPLVSHSLAVVLAAVVAAAITAGIFLATQDDCPTDEDNGDNDPERPYFHHTPNTGWVNDPNGLVYYKGLWHLFYQYDHDLRPSGHISWGHAVSTDLMHWNEKQVAISYTDNEQIFSGSAVVDENCSSGLCSEKGHPVLVAAYTSCTKDDSRIQSQHIAYSNDQGETWTKYEQNPVIQLNLQEFRDPKVFWHSDSNKWIMLVQMADKHILQFWKSDNLVNWNHEASDTFGPTDYDTGVWECPDLFEMVVEGESERRWVLIININPGQRIIGSGGQFYIGTFDGNRFQNTTPTEWFDWGMDNYATITYNNAPDNRRVAIGWMSNWNYTQFAPLTAAGTWRNGFTVPRELKLRRIDGTVRLTQMPVQEITTLRRKRIATADKVNIDDGTHGDNIRGKAVDIEAVFTKGSATEFGIRVFKGDGQETIIGYDTTTNQVFIDRSKSGTVVFRSLEDTEYTRFADVRHDAPLPLEKGTTLRLRVLVDTGSVEVFAGQGEISITDVVFPDRSKDVIEFYAKGGSVLIETYSIWSMGSIHGQ